jgi:hypothetical protein
MKELLEQILSKIMKSDEPSRAIKELRNLFKDEEVREEKQRKEEVHAFEGTIENISFEDDTWKCFFVTAKSQSGEFKVFQYVDSKEIRDEGPLYVLFTEFKKKGQKVRIYYLDKRYMDSDYEALPKVDVIS